MIKKSLKEGLFVTFEGGEGSGKTSLLQAVFEKVQTLGFDALKTRAPGGTKLGQKVREILLHTDNLDVSQKAEVLLFLSDRAQLVDEIIKPHLDKCGLVLCDRFTDSTIAYQGVSREGLDLNDVEMLANFAASDLKPDLTFYLDIDPLIGLQRAQNAITLDGKESYDRLEDEALAFHKNVRKAYLNIAAKEPKRVKVLDASKSKDLVLQETMHLIQETLGCLC